RGPAEASAPTGPSPMDPVLEDLEEEPLLTALEVSAAPQGDLLDARPEPVSRPGVGQDPAVLLVAREPGMLAVDHRIVDDDRAEAWVTAHPIFRLGQGEAMPGTPRRDGHHHRG